MNKHVKYSLVLVAIWLFIVLVIVLWPVPADAQDAIVLPDQSQISGYQRAINDGGGWMSESAALDAYDMLSDAIITGDMWPDYDCNCWRLVSDNQPMPIHWLDWNYLFFDVPGITTNDDHDVYVGWTDTPYGTAVTYSWQADIWPGADWHCTGAVIVEK